MTTRPRPLRFAAVLLLGLAAAACSDESPTFPPVFDPSLEINLDDMTRTTSGLYYLDIEVGTGATPMMGDSVRVDYTRLLSNGFEFDAAEDTFELTTGRLIPGFLEGILGMQVGGVRRLVIRPELGYGDNPPPGSGIPRDATLIFEVELLEIVE